MRSIVMAGLVAGLLSPWGADPALRTALVYMVEDGESRHIWMADRDGGHGRALTEGSHWHLYPDIDGAGNQVAWVQGPDARHLGVRVKVLATGVIEQWTPDAGMHLHPDFSGDGRFLAYSAPLPDGGQGIAVLDLQRERARRSEDPKASPTPRWVANQGPAYFPSLSSDGRLLVCHVVAGSGLKSLVLHDLKTNESRTIGPQEGENMAPAFSSDDRFVAFSRRSFDSWNIYITDWRAGTTRQVTKGFGKDHAPAFQPDGSLLFASDRGGRFEIWVIPAADLDRGDEAARRLSTSSGTCYAPASSGTLNEFARQSRLPSILPPARSSFGALEHQGRLWVAGGHKGKEHTYPPESFVAALDVYDPATGVWRRTAPRSLPCHGFQLAARGGFLYAFGGFAYSADHRPKWKSIDLIDRYDIANDRWETIGHLKQPRSSNVVSVVGGKAYIIGGWDSTPQKEGDYEGRFARSIEVFDLETETLTTAAFSLPDPLRRALTSIVVGNEIWLVGGLGVGATHFELLDNVTALDPATGTFCERPRLPFPTFAPAIGRVGADLLVMGGMFRTGARDYEYVNHIFRLPSGASRWEHTGRYLTENKGFSQVVSLPDGTLVILGGHSYDAEGDDGPVDTVETLEWR